MYAKDDSPTKDFERAVRATVYTGKTRSQLSGPFTESSFKETHVHDAASATATPKGDSTQSIAYPTDWSSELLIPWDFGVNTQGDELLDKLWVASDDGTFHEVNRPMDMAKFDLKGKFVKKDTTNMDIHTDLTLPHTLAVDDLKYHYPTGHPHAVVKNVEDVDKEERAAVGLDVDEETLKEQTLLDDGSQEPQFAQYIYTGNEPSHADICARFDKKIFNLDDDIHRPVPPSEGRGFTNTHPNCKCFWRTVEGAKFEWTPDKPSEADQTNITNVHKKIGQRAKSGKLHTVKQDGSLSQRTRSTNPRNVAYTVMREALLSVRQEFKWLTQKYEDAVRQLPVDGKWYVIRASTSTITDHRSEGEPYRRLLSSNELHALTRTAIGKEMDVNHNPDWKTEAIIYDAEYDVTTEQSQMLVLERDKDIIQAIDNGIITAVSINGGSPRSERIECGEDECFVVPEGVVLGELDNVALTWVVTDPRGFMYKGELVQPAMPGVKNTIIEPF